MIYVKRCWTGRLWVAIGGLAIGFGPKRFVEQAYWRTKLVYPRIS